MFIVVIDTYTLDSDMIGKTKVSIVGGFKTEDEAMQTLHDLERNVDVNGKVYCLNKDKPTITDIFSIEEYEDDDLMTW